MGDSPYEWEGFEGKYCDNLTLEVGADHVDDCDHQQPYDHVGFEGGEGHLLAEGFQLRLGGSYLFLVTFVLGLDHMRVL